jgi:hypothetical protein
MVIVLLDVVLAGIALYRYENNQKLAPSMYVPRVFTRAHVVALSVIVRVCDAPGDELNAPCTDISCKRLPVDTIDAVVPELLSAVPEVKLYLVTGISLLYLIVGESNDI